MDKCPLDTVDPSSQTSSIQPDPAYVHVTGICYEGEAFQRALDDETRLRYFPPLF